MTQTTRSNSRCGGGRAGAMAGGSAAEPTPVSFAFSEHMHLMAGMVVSVTAGSYVGTRLRTRVFEVFFRKLFKIVVTLLALRMICSDSILVFFIFPQILQNQIASADKPSAA